MKYKDLNRTHDDYDLARLQLHADLFEGGAALRSRIERYLPQNEMEPAATYKRRTERAHYTNYTARALRWFAAALFACKPTIESVPVATGPFWDAFREDCDGAGADLHVFMSAAFLDALVNRVAWWAVEFPASGAVPPGATIAEADTVGGRNAVLRRIPTENITHWRAGPNSSLAWVMERQCVKELIDITDESPTTTETWTVWKADGAARRWQVVWTKSRPRPDDDVPEVEAPVSPVGGMPLVKLELPSALHMAAFAAEPQLAHFRTDAAFTWALDRTCYAMPWFHLKNTKRPPTMGTGYFGILGVDERVEWPAPPAAPYDTLAARVASISAELHRVVEQMALSVDNASAAAIGRSGESKSADAWATQIILPAFGEHVREAIERTYDVVTAGRGEALAWDVGGMDRYTVDDVGSFVDTVLAAEPLRIPSATHRREVLKQVSRGMLPGVDEATRSKINAEIDAGTSAEEMRRESTIPPPPGGEGDETIPGAPRVPKEAKA